MTSIKQHHGTVFIVVVVPLLYLLYTSILDNGSQTCLSDIPPQAPIDELKYPFINTSHLNVLI